MDPIALTAISLQADLQKLNVIANNAANALTPGFKRELVAVAASLDGRVAFTSDPAESLNPLPLRVVSDNSPGAPRQTGNPLDMALLGAGYFEVQTPNGTAYTRQGTFRLDSQGRLVTEAGYAVAGVGGDIVLTTPNPTVDREGKVMENGKQVGQIKVVVFDGAAPPLRSLGGGLLTATGSQQASLSEHPRIAQGQLESSNVDSNREMVSMLETYRHFESASKVLQAYDDIRDKTFRALGQF
jgi:flagellar basal-body rod protein FlgF